MLSNYPNGFNDGVSLRGIPLAQIGKGKVYWVYNGTVLPVNHKGGSDGNNGTFTAPFSTLDYAVGQCTANRGDIIIVKEGHAENVTAANGIDLDVAGITVIGMGQGNARPTFTWSGTDATACIRINADNVTLRNVLCITSDTGDDIDNVILVSATADAAWIDAVEVREGLGQYDKAVNVADGATRCSITNCRFTQYTDGAGTNTQGCIAFDAETNASAGHRVVNNYLAGDFEVCPIIITDATQVISDLLIQGNVIQNTATGIYAIDLTTGTNVVGLVVDNRVSTDSSATSIRLGGAEGINNIWGLNNTDLPLSGVARSGPVKTSMGGAATVTSTAADEIAVVSAGGPIVVHSIVLTCTTLHEAEAAAVFDNVVTTSSGNLYTSDREATLQDSAFEVGDFLVLTPELAVGAVPTEAATAQVEDAGDLGFLVRASDTIDIEGGSAAAEGAVNVTIVYTSLGGDLEMEIPS